MTAAFLGLVAGLTHVLYGADHLAAVAPLSIEKRRGSWAVGFRWGIGHASGVLIVGFLAILLREVLPVEQLSSWAERLVGVMLIGIGLWGLRKALTSHVHVHEHEHAGQDHAHIHAHGPPTAHEQSQPKTHRHSHAAFAIGTLHGLAGSSHVLGIVPALAFATRTEAVTYMSAYGIGTILAMTSFAGALGLFAHNMGGGARLYRRIMVSCSSAAMIIGVYWLVA